MPHPWYEVPPSRQALPVPKSRLAPVAALASPPPDWPATVVIPCGMGDARNLIMALSGFLILGGRLGDQFGRRRVFLIGTVAFAAGSALL